MARRGRLVGLLPALAGLLALLTTAGVAEADYVGGLNPMGDNFLSLRTGPGTRYREILRLGPDTYVAVIGQSGNWLRVRLDDGTVGWAYSRYILPGEPMPPEPAFEPPPEAAMPDQPMAMPEAPAAMPDQPAAMPEMPAATPPDEAAGPAAPPPAVAPSPVAEWVTYANPRFGTRIRYPAELFVPQPPPANGDGRTFAAANDGAQFIVFGQFNAFEKTLAELMADDKADPRNARVTYQRSGSDWYVLSGYRDHTVFYRKVLLRSGGEVVHVFEIDYPASAKSTFDPMVAAMAKSFAAPDEASAPTPGMEGGDVAPQDQADTPAVDAGGGADAILNLFPDEPGE